MTGADTTLTMNGTKVLLAKRAMRIGYAACFQSGKFLMLEWAEDKTGTVTNNCTPVTGELAALLRGDAPLPIVADRIEEAPHELGDGEQYAEELARYFRGAK